MAHSRFFTFATIVALFVASATATMLSLWFWPFAVAFGLLTLVGVRDLVQTRHAINRNYPVIGHFRYLIEAIRPELRQYLFEDDTVATPFSRSQRSIVYQRAKGELDKRPFGTQLDVYQVGYEWVNHSMVPAPIQHHDFRVNIGQVAADGEPTGYANKPGVLKPYSASVFNISAMSFGALSAECDPRAQRRRANRRVLSRHRRGIAVVAITAKIGGDIDVGDSAPATSAVCERRRLVSRKRSSVRRKRNDAAASEDDRAEAVARREARTWRRAAQQRR